MARKFWVALHRYLGLFMLLLLLVIALTGSVNAALIGFIVFYALCAGLNWWYYARKNAEAKC